MEVTSQITAYLATQPEPKRRDLEELHRLIQELIPEGPLWFLDGKDAQGKTVTNPNIGYGTQTMTYADGTSREFYRIGISANTSGISIYLMGLRDKKALAERFATSIGKARVTGYCIQFRALKDLHRETLEAALRFGLNPA